MNLMSTEGGESSRYLKAGNTYDRSEDLKCVRRVEICTSNLKHLHADRTVQHTSDAEQDDRKCLGDSVNMRTSKTFRLKVNDVES